MCHPAQVLPCLPACACRGPRRHVAQPASPQWRPLSTLDAVGRSLGGRPGGPATYVRRTRRGGQPRPGQGPCTAQSRVQVTKLARLDTYLSQSHWTASITLPSAAGRKRPWRSILRRTWLSLGLQPAINHPSSHVNDDETPAEAHRPAPSTLAPLEEPCMRTSSPLEAQLHMGISSRRQPARPSVFLILVPTCIYVGIFAKAA